MKEYSLSLFDIKDLEVSIKDLKPFEIAEKLDHETLYLLHQAYMCKLYLGTYDNETVERVVKLSDYVYCKSEDNRSESSIADALFMLIDTGKSIDELENMDKWQLFENIDSVSCY